MGPNGTVLKERFAGDPFVGRFGIFRYKRFTQPNLQKVPAIGICDLDFLKPLPFEMGISKRGIQSPLTTRLKSKINPICSSESLQRRIAASLTV